jgi:isopentenyl-diphosphate Delta-isomerase
MTAQEVILVNERDEAYGTAGKMEAHEKGLLHRAFSIFIFNPKGELLLQQRARHKYHSGGLWTNTCCSHPAPGEDLALAAKRRLKEEMGISAPLTEIFCFTYRAEFENGLVENEIDHVFVGVFNGQVSFDKEEVMDYCYKDIGSIKESMISHPSKYTAWFKIAFPYVEKWRGEQ